MFRIYRAVRLNHRDDMFTLTTSNYHDALKYAIENSVPTLSSCEIGLYDFHAGWNALY